MTLVVFVVTEVPWWRENIILPRVMMLVVDTNVEKGKNGLASLHIYEHQQPRSYDDDEWRVNRLGFDHHPFDVNSFQYILFL
mmetsp:Transcript_39864/g.82906  ORF Transcript_39864/g.82906 Transcript_39864/m.82906 type:complete len:82 (-) Transcript_39864:119-364(-)